MNSRKAINRWAHDAGFADFDTYIRAGGSIITAKRDILERMRRLHEAMDALDHQVVPPQNAENPNPVQIAPIAPNLEAEPPDPHNAHPQGAEHEP